MAVEHVLALALAAIDEGEEPPIPEPTPVDFWPGLVADAARTRVLPLVAARLAADGTGRVPRWVVRIAEAMYTNVAHRNTALRDITGTLSRRLCDAGVPFAVRKGLHVAELYPAWGARPIGDIDVLVAPEAVGDAVATAKSLGFTEVPMTRAQRVWMSIATHNAPPLEYRPDPDGDALGLDFTTSLMLPVMREPPDDERVAGMLSRTVANRHGLPVLSPADLLLDLMLNSYIVQTTLRYVRRLRFQRLCYHLDVLVAARQVAPDELKTLDLDSDTLRDAATFAIGNVQRLAPYAPTTAVLEACLPPDRRDVLDTVGQWELDTPYRWRESLTRRLVLDHLPDDLPPAHALI